MGLIIETHAAPEVEGVTRAGSGIILELISLSLHGFDEPGQLVNKSNLVKMRMCPQPQTQKTNTQGLTAVFVPLPVAPALFEIKAKGKEALMCFFFFFFC